jgi:D-amino peptidase
MKIYISADIEGVTGVTHWDETDLSKDVNSIAREQMTAEVVAACQGALQAGATEILVRDAHDTGRNIIASRLPHEARLLRGWSGNPLLMMQELDDSYQAALLIGYHSRAGAGASPLEHTFSGKFVNVKLNDRYASEFLIAAYTAAYLKVPLVFVSGDQGLCDEIAGFSPVIRAVAVKEGVGDSTINIHPELAVARIRDGVENALQADLSRCLLPLPAAFWIDACYREHFKAYQYSFYPGASLKDPMTVHFESEDFFEILRFMLFVS